MPESGLVTILLSCLVSTEKAVEIEGDLLEDHPQASRIQLLGHAFAILPPLLWYRFARAPLVSMGIGLITVFLIYLLTTLLLMPLILKAVDIRVWSVLVVLFLFRGFASFVVGVVIHDYAGKQAVTGLLCAQILLVIILVVRLVALLQGTIEPGPVTLGVLQSLFFYLGCTIVPLSSGFLYSRYMRCQFGSSRTLEPRISTAGNV